MSTIEEIVNAAKKAVNESVLHYFKNMTMGDEKYNELIFITEYLSEVQPWLFFSEQSLIDIRNKILKDTLHVNLVYNLTLLFRAYLCMTEGEYQTLVQHLADSLSTAQASDTEQSLMAKQYLTRMPDRDSINNLMDNNRSHVMLICLTLFLDTDILVEETKATGRQK